MESHIKPGQRLASASQSKGGTKSSFAATQAAWRFYANEKTSLSKLAEPLVEASKEGIEAYCEAYALIVHDWSSLNYTKHEGKVDKKDLHNQYEQGYEVQSSIVLSDKNGMALGVMVQNMTTKGGVWSSYQGDNLQPEEEHLQELSRRVKWLEEQAIGKKQVHLVDREGDGVEWLRANRESNWLMLRLRSAQVRCRQNSTVNYVGKSYQVKQLAEQLTYSINCREIKYKGKVAYQRNAKIEVELVRAAKPKRKRQDQEKTIKGEALPARLVVSRVEDGQGKILAEWYLLTNVFAVSPETIATWYYWRWQIECFFKLLKQQGLQIEEWQQESSLAIAKRLLVASAACVLVWQLQHQQSPQASEIKTFLVRLSGRQMKKNRPVTSSALFEGLWLFLTMMDTLEHYSIAQLTLFRQLVSSFWGDTINV